VAVRGSGTGTIPAQIVSIAQGQLQMVRHQYCPLTAWNQACDPSFSPQRTTAAQIASPRVCIAKTAAGSLIAATQLAVRPGLIAG
jgi:hypothetical protein